MSRLINNEISDRIIEAMDFDSDDKNWKFSFKVMTKKYGRDFIEILKAMWSANGESQSEIEFCEMNEISFEFFTKLINK